MGRVLFLCFLAMPWVMLYFYLSLLTEWTVGEHIFYLLFIISLIVGAILLNWYFWQIFWGKLTVTENGVIWTCFLCRSVKLAFDEISEYKIKVYDKSEGNAVYFSGSGDRYQYILLANEKIPAKRLDKLRCQNGVIKFRYSVELVHALRDGILVHKN